MIRFVIPSIWPTACLLSYASPAQYLAEIITRLCTTHTHTQRERDGLLLILVQQARTNYSKKGSRLCTQQLDANESVSLSLSVHTHLKRTGGIVEMSQESLSISQESDSRVRQQPSVHTDRAKPRGIDRSHFAVQTQPSKTHVRERERDRQKRLHRPPSGILTFSAFFLQSNQIVKNQVDIISLHVLKVYIRKQVDPPTTTTTTKGKQQKTWHNGPRVIW